MPTKKAVEKPKRTDEEQACVQRLKEKVKTCGPRATTEDGKLKFPDDGVLFHAQLAELTGTNHPGFALGLIREISLSVPDASDPRMEEFVFNDITAVFNGVKPQNELESMLLSQMIATHKLMLYCGRLAATTDRIDHINQYVNWMTKLSRTFTTQMDTLKKYRTGGQQKVTVEHVHVHQGGQAIVGNVETGGEGEASKE